MESITKEQLIQKYWHEWKSITELSKEFNCTYYQISKKIEELNIKKRSRKGKNLRNKIFEKWKVIEIDLDDKRPGLYWKCQCECGFIKSVAGIELRRKHSTRCKNCHHKSFIKNYGEMRNFTFYHIECSALARGLELKVTPEYLWDLYLKQDKKCKLSGIEIEFSNDINKRYWIKTTASLDRIDNTKGYIEGNCQWIHKEINKMKWKLNEQQFINHCCRITDLYRSKNNE